MSRQAYERLLEEFQELAVEVGSQSFDLRWHNLSDLGRCFQTDEQGNWVKIEWPPELPKKDWPFDPAKRLVVGQLRMPLSDSGASFTSRFDPVTLPKVGAAAGLVSEKVGPYCWRMVCVIDRFRGLSERAGIALPPLVGDRLVRYCPVTNTSRANRWYALLFALSGQTAARRDGKSVVHKRELIVPRPDLISVDAIQQFRLNTDDPGLPEGLCLAWFGSKRKGVKAGGKRGRKPDPEIAKRDAKIVKRFNEGRNVNAIVKEFRISSDLARKIKSNAGLTAKDGRQEDTL